MKTFNQDHVIESYRHTFQQHGDTPAAVQFSTEGQRWRFDKLLEIATKSTGQSLQGKKLLEIGCGLGHLYPLLRESFGDIEYTGIDIVPEMIEHASALHPDATFECRDVFESPFVQEFDFVFISGVFNAPVRDNSLEFMSEMLAHAYSATRFGLAFNFISSHVNFVSEGMDYFDPSWVLREVLNKLSKKVVMHHHYHSCDVAVCVTR